MHSLGAEAQSFVGAALRTQPNKRQLTRFQTKFTKHSISPKLLLQV